MFLGELIPVVIEGVFGIQQGGETRHLVLLSDGERKLPIMIGMAEAHAIAQALEDIERSRPLTHDLIKNMLDKLGATVDRVNIDDLFNNTYYARIIIKSGDELIEIDSRPSDAVAIAVRYDAPIYVADGILDTAEDIL